MSIKGIIKKNFYYFVYGIQLGLGSSISLPVRMNGTKYMKIGRNVHIGKYGWINCIDAYYNFTYYPKLEIQDNVNIGSNACISLINSIIIKQGCLISEHFYISDHYHDFDPEAGPIIKQKLVDKGEIVIGENVFIGYRVSVLPGVHIGNNCVIGSHAVVTKSCPPYSMLAGIPARIIKKYDSISKEWVPVENKEQ